MIRVLLVDDHELVRSALARFLHGQGDIEIVGQASSAEEAFPIVEREKPDVLVLDLGLPGLSGTEFAMRVLAQRPQQAILVVSSRSEPQEVQLLISAGVRGIVSKFSASDELLRAVRSVSQGNHHFCPTTAGALVVSVRAQPEQKNPLSVKQVSVLQQMARGRTTREIAEEMCLSPKTVEKYRGEILRRLNARNQVEALEAARRLNLLPT